MTSITEFEKDKLHMLERFHREVKRAINPKDTTEVCFWKVRHLLTDLDKDLEAKVLIYETTYNSMTK
jgi:hypothetical protein